MSTMWQIKCFRDSLKAAFPFQRQLRRLKDHLVGYRREPLKDLNTIRDGFLLLDLAGNVSGKHVLEIGTGWQPMIPILFSLMGAKVYLTDLYALMRPETFRAALDAIRDNRVEIATKLSLDPEQIDWITRDSNMLTMSERLHELRLEYLAPCNCQRLSLPDGSIDVVMSRAVLEHIPPNVIQGIFGESHRILRPGGMMLHLVDHSDHWSHRDKRINAVNFLRYPDWLFWMTCINPQNYQNRLRHSQYRSMLESAGFSIKSERRTVDTQCLASISQMRTSAKFRQFSAEDLATVDSVLLAES